MNFESEGIGANPVRPCMGEGEIQVQGVEDDEIEIEAEVCEESRVPKRMQNPMLPSKAEREVHELTHVPFRSWCEHCVRGRGEGVRHEAGKEMPEQTEVHMDFFFVGDEGQNKKLTVLAVRERTTRMTMSAVAPSKGEQQFLAKRVQAFLKEIGADTGDITLRSDQEPAMKVLLSEVSKHRAAAGGGRTVIEHSAVEDSKGNGVIERAVKSIEGQTRVARSALEARIGAKIEPEHAVMTWLIEHVSLLLNRYEVGRDGRTAYERNKNKSSKLMGLEFGECVLWRRRPVGNNLAKLAVLWDVGVYLGVKGSTGEIIIGNSDGVWRTRTVRRRPEELRWKAEEIEKIKGLPWNHGGEKKDGEVVKLERLPEELMQQEKQAIKDELSKPKAFHTKQEDYDKYGYSRGCQGCRALLTGTTRQKHTPQCRQRMEREMGDLERVKAAKRRREDFLEKVMVPTKGKDDDSMVIEQDGAAKLRSSDQGECLKQGRKSGAIGAAKSQPATLNRSSQDCQGDSGDFLKNLEGHDDVKVEERATGSGTDEAERKRAWQQIDWQEFANMLKKKKPEVEKEGDVDMGAMEVNIEEDEWGNWVHDEGHDEYNDNDFDPKLLQEARMEEVSFMQNIGVWEPSTWEECMQKTGKAPITTKWVDVDKGRDGEVLVRSRLVARDFKSKNDERNFDVFAATPPLEMKRLLFRMARVKGSVGGSDKDGQVKLMYIDVKKAHLNGEVDDNDFAYIMLPKEVGGGVGRLRRWLYGMRPAASAWEDHYAANLKKEGYERGRAAPTAFVNKVTGVRVVVWGDDFTFLGRERHLKEIGAKMAEWYDIKIRGMMGPDAEDDKEIRILNRVVKWEHDKLIYEADDKHVKKILFELGFDENTKGNDMPIAKDFDAEGGEDDEDLEAHEARRYRMMAATINYLASDRPDLQFTASVLGRTMARPTVRSWSNLKKAARYLKEHPRVRYEYSDVTMDEVSELEGYSDSDWAGCKRSRRSMSGGMAVVGGAVVKSWANRQATVALSSGEAEFYSAGKAAAELIGIKSLMMDMGWNAGIKLHVDATVAQAMANRQGIGKIRHLEVRYLWLQEMAKSGVIAVRKVSGIFNPADVLTKPMSFSDMFGKLGRVHVFGDLGLQSQVEGGCRQNMTPVGLVHHGEPRCPVSCSACQCRCMHPSARPPNGGSSRKTVLR
jgi:hypothetical protein